MRRWWADNGEATLEDLVHRPQSVLDLGGKNWKTAEKDGHWTEVVRRTTKST